MMGMGNWIASYIQFSDYDSLTRPKFSNFGMQLPVDCFTLFLYLFDFSNFN